MTTGAATRLSDLAAQFLGGPLPVRLRTWDGDEAGPTDAPVVVLTSRRALRRLLWQPGELGLAEAYITGDLDVEGDLGDGLRHVWRAVRERGLHPPRLRPGDLRASAALLGDAARTAVRLGVPGPRPASPAEQARLSGALHSKRRDRAAISHHYDLSNAFYELLLDPSMAYSCGYWTSPPDTEGYGLADAQRDKLELICRKLDLRPGMRLLDVGCGWGSLSLYAAEHRGVRVTSVTLAAEQAAFVRARAAERGLADRVDVQLCDYRDIDGGGFDAAVSIEMGEHVGDAQYPEFAAMLRRMLRPRGRVLVQQMSRGATAPGGGAFIETYIAPDMHMRPLGQTVSLLEDAGLEVRDTQSLREDYVHTVQAWHRTLEERWDDVVALVGLRTARVWRLYLVGGALAFEERRMGVDQILGVRPGPDGDSGMTGTPRAWHTDEGTTP
ncbi:cyclopropane-fatty-acyl-phospholipid synthase family protein [Streptomyces sp. GSL17-111]|uniref:cyclopropane-fatty-acyl-phospholipid synthase family protein n=1 Tax=Streptomyces sp. GSL17-111 TaxID=3121596 RepID=UPI0030F44C2E